MPQAILPQAFEYGTLTNIRAYTFKRSDLTITIASSARKTCR